MARLTVWYCIFIELTAKWPMAPTIWDGIWQAVQGQHVEQLVLWPTRTTSDCEACGLSVQSNSPAKAERIALASIKEAVRSTVRPSKNVHVSQLKRVLDGPCWELADFPDSPH